MTGRNRRGSRRAGMKARIGVAAAVLIGGGAAGVAAIAASDHGPASNTVSDAGYIMSFRHHIGDEAALSSALSTWRSSHQTSLNTLAQMVTMRTFTQVWGSHHRTMYAAQRGVVVAATKQFLLVKSANGQEHLWWLTGTSAFQNVTASPTGMIAMTGNNAAAAQAVVNQNTVPAQTAVAGSTTAVTQAAAPAKPVTITIVTGNETITITITPTTTVVTTPSATATATVTPTATATITPAATASMTATATATTTAKTIAAGDLVFVAGVRHHGQLTAQLVLFSAPTTTTATASASATATTKPTATPTATPSATPTVTTSATATVKPTATPTATYTWPPAS